ncbi:hypothetical protein FGRMN_3255 [Fusarium graminum]|nr:hypothetical protein FGRMN_3255 [Fusarium graminum]
MTTKDIRESIDISTGGGLQVANAILQGCPPLFKQKATSSLDCLVVVLRRIYSHCLHPDALACLKFPDGNPILGYAWHRFGDEPGEREEAGVEKERVCDELRKAAVPYTAAFNRLCCSELMNRTFWSQDVFQLIDVLSTETGKSIECSSEIAGMSLLSLDHTNSPDLSLQDVVKNAFGLKPSWGKVVFTPGKPWVIRVSYKSSIEEDKCLKFDDLRRLQLPKWEYDYTNQAFMKIGSIEYVLIAIVCSTDEGKAVNCVRTYANTGVNIVGVHEPISFMNSNWSVSDPAASYMLFYGLINEPLDPDGPQPYPEIAEGQKIDQDTLEAMDKVLSPLVASPPADPSLALMKHFTTKHRRGSRPGKESAPKDQEEDQDIDRERRQPGSQDLGTSATREARSQDLGDGPNVRSNERGKGNHPSESGGAGPKRRKQKRNRGTGGIHESERRRDERRQW